MAGKGVAVSPGFFITSKKGGGVTVPGGVNQDIQFNDNGSFGGEHTDGISTPGMTWDKVTGSFAVLAKSPGGSVAVQAGPTDGNALQIDDSGIVLATEGPTSPVVIGTSDPTSDIDINAGGSVEVIAGSTGNIVLAAGPTTSNGVQLTPTAIVIGADESGATLTLEASDDSTLRSTGGDTIIDGAGSVALQNSGVIALVTQESTGTPKIGFLGANPTARITVTGSRASGAALQSLLTALATLGLITDGTTT